MVIMPAQVSRHFDEEAVERYSMGKLSARKTAAIEEHLLICESCCRRVVESDAYVAAIRKAAAKLRKAERKPRRSVANK
jgi:anti-sigma factor RsiW